MAEPRWTRALILAAAIVSGCGGDHSTAPIAEPPLRETVMALVTSGPALIASIHEGIARTTDEGDTWTIVHPDLAFDLTAEGDVVFATTLHGVLRSDDNGLTWSNRDAGLPPGFHALSVVREGNTVIVTLPYEGLLGVSSDLGDTWKTCSAPASPFSVLIRDAVLYVGAPDGSLYRSTDGGQSWLQSNPFNSYHSVTTLAARGDRLFAGSFAALAVSASSDGGESWEPRQSGLPTPSGLYSLDSRGADLYAGTMDGLYRSVDDGATWSRFPIGSDPLGVLDSAEHSGVLFAATAGNGVHRSTDRGVTWVKVHDLGTLGDPPTPVD